MSFRASLLLLCAVSLLAGAVLCLAQTAIMRLGNNTALNGKGIYAALLYSAEIPDREIRRLLSESGNDNQNFANSIISESSQWVFLDDFSSLKQIPLDEYKERVQPLDPRNDGYAAKLESFFTRNGQRIMFIPLNQVSAKELEKRLSVILSDIPFTFEIISFAKPLLLFFLIFVFACIAVYLVKFLPLRPRQDFTALLFGLPALGALTFYGAAGLALAALLPGISVLLKEPVNELCMLLKNNKKPLVKKEFFARFMRDVFGPYKLYWLVVLAFSLFYFMFSVFTNVFILISILVFVTYLALFVFSVIILARQGEALNHRRFIPVLITKAPLSLHGLRVMLPFILAAVAAGVSTAALPGAPAAESLVSLQGTLVTEDDYLKHAAFQSSFSYRPLGKEPEHDEYPAYILDRDNLLIPVQAKAVQAEPSDIPQFPLKNLIKLLSNYRGDKNRNK